MSDMSEEEINARANEKSRKRKEARDRMLATKTIEKGLLIVHTGKGKRQVRPLSALSCTCARARHADWHHSVRERQMGDRRT